MPRTLSTAEVADFRERLCEAAAKIFTEKGEEGFTLRELAAALGVSPMTPYRYFHDKDEILAAVRARAFQQFAHTLEAAYGKGTDAASRASSTGEAYIRFALENPGTYKLMFDLAQSEHGKYPELTEAADRARLTMTRHIPGLIEAGLLEGDPSLIGHVYWVVLHGAVTLKLAGKLEQNEMSEILDTAFDALNIGFSPKKSRD
ncbi:MAG TPA: TetR/AcrR family transcriptional regulator [Rhizomicrobium sp.]